MKHLKMRFVVLSLLLFFAYGRNYAKNGIDYIHDEYIETNRFALHSQGLLSYGAHTNTFHLRYAFIRGNLNVGNFRLFTTLNGYKDTHNPALTYNYNLGNISLYDYGVRYQLPAHLFLSLRGAAVFRKNHDSLLLIPAFYHNTNPGEFDSPAVYQNDYINPAGIRAGYFDRAWTIAYSQGDYRHSIPMAVIVKYKNDLFYIRGLVQLQNANPLVYAFDLYRGDIELSASLHFSMGPGKLLFLAVGNNSALIRESRLRIETAYNWHSWTIATRYMWKLSDFGGTQSLFEGSLDYSPSPSWTRIGIFASSDGRIYIASKIDF